jgi:hypothetical protein
MLGFKLKENVDMRSGLARVGLGFTYVMLAMGLMIAPAFAAKAETFIGEIGDSMCGAKHEMAGNAAECTRDCIKQGSKYALISGDKVYTLETTDKATLDQLDKLAGQKAKVTGSANGTTIQVSSVAGDK